MRDNHIDCGDIIFNSEAQNTDAGGSGCGCSAVVASGYLYKKLMRKEIKFKKYKLGENSLYFLNLVIITNILCL